MATIHAGPSSVAGADQMDAIGEPEAVGFQSGEAQHRGIDIDSGDERSQRRAGDRGGAEVTAAGAMKVGSRFDGLGRQ